MHDLISHAQLRMRRKFDSRDIARQISRGESQCILRAFKYFFWAIGWIVTSIDHNEISIKLRVYSAIN